MSVFEYPVVLQTQCVNVSHLPRLQQIHGHTIQTFPRRTQLDSLAGTDQRWRKSKTSPLARVVSVCLCVSVMEQVLHIQSHTVGFGRWMTLSRKRRMSSPETEYKPGMEGRSLGEAPSPSIGKSVPGL